MKCSSTSISLRVSESLQDLARGNYIPVASLRTVGKSVITGNRGGFSDLTCLFDPYVYLLHVQIHG